MLLSNRTFRYYLAGLISLSCLTGSSLTQAQPITSDGSLSTSVETTDNQNFTITGGERAGNNLFHSFEEFSVPNGGSASFNNASTIQNIFSRVTGGSVSDIDGLIKTNHSANLFLINPNGIIFSENASLDIGGSFLATTANGIQFADGTFLSATDSHSSAILTVSVPIGLQFGETPGSIRNQSQANFTGLQVKPGNTLALVGGEIFLEGGIITALEGRIKLGSVAPNSFVRLNSFGQDLSLGYEEVVNFQDIQLTASSFINVSGDGGGDVRVQGRRVTFNNSSIAAINTGEIESLGDLIINASELVELSGFRTGLSTTTSSVGGAGNIEITTSKLIIQDGASITAQSTELITSDREIISPTGRAGNISIDAAESIELRGNGSLISTQTFGEGNGGDLTISTKQLTVQDETLISTDNLELGGDAGNLTITTEELNVLNQGEISVSASGLGSAGSLTINAQNIILDRGILSAQTKAGREGNITITDGDTLLLRNNSEITTNAQNNATGGNINITSAGIALLNNSNITANAEDGRGGNIQITTERLFQEPNSFITAFSDRNIDGIVIIESPDLDPSSGIFELGDIPVDISKIFDQNLCQLKDGKIAGGSKFIITGRGGITPTSTEPLDNLDRVVDWANRDDLQISQNGIVGVRQRSVSNTPENNYPVIQQSQGWVTASDGSIWLVTNPPETIPQNSRLAHPDCRS